MILRLAQIVSCPNLDCKRIVSDQSCHLNTFVQLFFFLSDNHDVWSLRSKRCLDFCSGQFEFVLHCDLYGWDAVKNVRPASSLLCRALEFVRLCSCSPISGWPFSKWPYWEVLCVAHPPQGSQGGQGGQSSEAYQRCKGHQNFTLLPGDGLSGLGKHLPPTLPCHVHFCCIWHVTLQECQGPARIWWRTQFPDLWKDIHTSLSGRYLFSYWIPYFHE